MKSTISKSLCILVSAGLILNISLGAIVLNQTLVNAQTAKHFDSKEIHEVVAEALQEFRIRNLHYYYRESIPTLWESSGVVFLERVDAVTGDVLPGISDIAIFAFAEGRWQYSFPGDSNYSQVMSRLPPSLVQQISYSSRPSNAPLSLYSIDDYELPWGHDKWATVTRSYDTGHGTGRIDFDLDDDDIQVAAAKRGRIIYANDSHSINTYQSGAWWYWNTVVVEHSSGEYSTYGHLLKDSIPSWIKNQCSGDYFKANCSVNVEAGQVIGRQGNTGMSSAAHLHVQFGSRFTIGLYDDSADEDGDSNKTEKIPTGYAGWNNANGNYLHNVSFKTYNLADVAAWPYLKRLKAYHQNTTGGVCPNSVAGVVLYRDTNFGCGGRGENEGFVQRSDTGFQNLPAGINDTVSSMRIKDGWSVKVYKDANRNGGYMCISGNPSDFSDWTLSDGTRVVRIGQPVYDSEISSFEVYSLPRCGEPPPKPNPPTLQSPGDNASVQQDDAPSLCWSPPTVNAGGQLRYFAEAFNSQRTVQSGWISNGCWQPSALNGQFQTYQWRVKVQNGDSGESDWSNTRQFMLVRPNQPPAIQFNTANGNTNTEILTREQNWTFAGTASDQENALTRVEFRCENCENQGTGTSGPSLNGGTWTHTRSGMQGENNVYFAAFDDRNQSTHSRKVKLRIDLTPPSSRVELNSQSSGWPAWFNNTVQAKVVADDQPTGKALAGVREVRYRIDNGNWTTASGREASFSISGDGSHSVYYYAVDNVGNADGSESSPKRANFRIDATAPAAPSGATETNGAQNNTWQKVANPIFSWNAATDNASGTRGYELYFGDNPNGEGYQWIDVSAARQWNPQPGGVRTGTYYLRGRSRDVANNSSPFITLFTFRYDGTPPANPKNVTHAQGAQNDTWQTTINVPNFTWAAATDEGSGIKGYFVYWGTDPNGTSTSFVSTNSFQSATPLCSAGQTCVGYLRLRSEDNVGNVAEQWTTAFVLRYDNAPPTTDFLINGGVTETTQTQVVLSISASDTGSGVNAMSLSNNGSAWSDWEAIVPQRLFTIPAVSGVTHPIYLRARDRVGLVSAPTTHSIKLEVNPQQPRSENYRLFVYNMSASGGTQTSTLYSLHSTVGQVMDSSILSSTSYRISSGYEAARLAVPILDPGSISGTITNTVPISSGTQPTPTIVPSCEFPTISVNNAALYVNSAGVQLNLCAPRATEMKLSNDGGFGSANWEPYTTTKSWTLTTLGQLVIPRFVYAAYRDADGTIHATYIDDIIYDPNAPSGAINIGDSQPTSQLLASTLQINAFDKPKLQPNVAEAGGFTIGSTRYVQQYKGQTFAQPLAVLTPSADGTVDVYLNASDDNSGMAEMQVSASPSFTDTTWEAFSARKAWNAGAEDGVKTVYARFRDQAGNVSGAFTGSFILDRGAPGGGIAVSPRIVGPSAVTITIFLGGEDFLSAVDQMRVADNANFVGSAWEPFASSKTMPLYAPTNGTFYAQYRDAAGNVSPVYSDTYALDQAPPKVFVEVEPASSSTTTLTRQLKLYGFDELSDITAMKLTNDPRAEQSVSPIPFASTMAWTFDSRRVVWVQLIDAVGNVSEAFPAYADERVAAPAPKKVYLPLIRR